MYSHSQQTVHLLDWNCNLLLLLYVILSKQNVGMFEYIHEQVIVFIGFLLLFTIVESIINLYKEMNVWSFKYHIKPQLDLEDTMPNLFSSFELPQMHIRESPHLPLDDL